MIKWCCELTSKYVTLYVCAELNVLGEIHSFVFLSKWKSELLFRSKARDDLRI